MNDEDEDDGMERGDEIPYYPPIGSTEWLTRLWKATQELREARDECFSACKAINEGAAKLFRELEGQ